MTDRWPEVHRRLKRVIGAMDLDCGEEMPESKALYELALKVPEGQAIIEIGSWCGRSTCALALGSKHGNNVPVYSIDPHECIHEGISNHGGSGR